MHKQDVFCPPKCFGTPIEAAGKRLSWKRKNGQDETTSTYNLNNWYDNDGNKRNPIIGLLYELRHAADMAGKYPGNFWDKTSARDSETREMCNCLRIMEASC